MDIVDYIYDECHRQHVTNYGDFAIACDYAQMHEAKQATAQKFSGFVQMIAFIVEPSINNFIVRTGTSAGMDNLRTSHVGFMDGGSAAPVNEVRDRFNRWCELAFECISDPIDNGVLDENLFEQLIKNLLDIHPWADGNGRTASILRNWMLGTLDDPSPLPYYYGNV